MGCEVVLPGTEEQVSSANQHKEQQLGLKPQIERLPILKKPLKLLQQRQLQPYLKTLRHT